MKKTAKPQTKICPVCKKRFHRQPRHSDIDWIRRTNCSSKCALQAAKRRWKPRAGRV